MTFELGWHSWKLAHAYNRIGSGTTPTSGNADYYNDDDGTPWITTSELRETYIQRTSINVTQLALDDFTTLRIYAPNSVFMAMYGATIGRLGISAIPATCNQACCVFETSDKFDNRFLFYWLWHRRAELISLSVGGGQPNLSQQDLKSEKAFCPPLATQKRIVAFLDEKTARIDALIAKKQALLERLAEKRQATITQAVTKGLNPTAPLKDSGIEWLGQIPAHWEVRRVRFDAIFNPVKSELSLPDDTEVSFVPMDAVGALGGLKLDQTRFIADVYDGYTYFANGDLCIAKITPCFENGKGSIAENLINNVAFGTTELHVIRPTATLDIRFMFYVSIAHDFRSIGGAEMLGAGGQKRVPENFLKNWRAPTPDIKEQFEIVEFLDSETSMLDIGLNSILMSCEKLIEYRSTLITAAITGQLEI